MNKLLILFALLNASPLAHAETILSLQADSGGGGIHTSYALCTIDRDGTATRTRVSRGKKEVDTLPFSRAQILNFQDLLESIASDSNAEDTTCYEFAQDMPNFLVTAYPNTPKELPIRTEDRFVADNAYGRALVQMLFNQCGLAVDLIDQKSIERKVPCKP